MQAQSFLPLTVMREKNSSPIGKVRDVAIKVEISLIVGKNNYATL